ncbi:RNA 2',3'-cyclic phosphodiesterase [Deinococcus enclensis]|uniref:RNA 2',3'-cyclic phosphodiesterase n=1 Tax=Deinococcus enclensis TaxID=1049582 RepID=A0ABT9M926_9DEIO|nr:RNA 2',3'-cyclic phosphodiesterase [Deinococcus enclensis]MDP9763084.1 2'-5' RNA ligase [Deinococcus enclensis]
MTKIRRAKKPTPRPDATPSPAAPVQAAPAPARTAPAKAKAPAPKAKPKADGKGQSTDTIKVYTRPGQGGRPQAAGQNAGRGEAHTPGTLRLFYALKVPMNIANPLAERQRQLRGNWRAVRADQMHVTLAYLPSVPPEKLADLKRLGTRLTEHLPPMDVKLRGTGYFPNEGSPRVWFVKVEAEGLTELAAELRAGIQALGLETDEQPFKAHITLARKKGPAPRVPPLTFDAGWQAGAAALYRSILRKTGPIYELESTFRFRGTPSTPDPATTPGTEKTLTPEVTQEKA